MRLIADNSRDLPAAGAPAGRGEDSPGRQPWVDKYERLASPGGTAEDERTGLAINHPVHHVPRI